ncbi:MAG: GNAT family N-acetyltransferase [Verrucomicrobiales bacterium]|jgi:ribosomal protein S18 acetylase RimI-like enzyme|nr:GNAT family N-acetyltransferase [Verrucomicrobiales bacterium]
MNVNITLAEPADIPALAGLLAMLFEQEYDFNPDRTRQERAIALLLQEPEHAWIWVARADSVPVGMISLQSVISTAEGGKSLWLEDWIVHPACRGRGIGGRLLRYAIEQARARGFRRISLLTDRDNLSAQGRYAEQGFKPSAMLPMRLLLPEDPTKM